MADDPEFTFGIEEECLLVEPRTMSLAIDPPQGVFELARARAEETRGNASHELIRAQIEIATAVCRTPGEAADQLKALRQSAIAAAEAHGLALIACSAHPFAYADDQLKTDQHRYRELNDDLQFAARRLMVSGMHVHIGIGDAEMRIKVLNALREYLPLFLALTASSPFWEGRSTGLKSVRPVILDELPRSGLPDRFASLAAYNRTVDGLVKTGLIEDASKIWWDARFSAKWPTVEIRIMDVCPDVEDALAMAAFCRCVCRMLWRKTLNQEQVSLAPRLIVMENRWRAQKYGAQATLIDHERATLRPVLAWVREIALALNEDAVHFGCEDAIDRVLVIAEKGTSADRQIAVFDNAITRGDGDDKALRGLVESLVLESRQMR